MGLFARGAHDIFIGKVGNVVGSTWKDEQVMRAVPLKKKNRTFTQPQLEQHAKFRMAIEHLQYLSPLFEVTFKKYTKDKTGMNVALSHTFDAITGTYPNYDIDWPKFIVSKGSAEEAQEMEVAPITDGIRIEWFNEGLPIEIREDPSFIVVYCPELKRFRYSMTTGLRSAGAATILTPNFKGKLVHLWFGFISKEGNNASNSMYAGQVTVL